MKEKDKEEFEKCKNDPYYFYKEYCQLDGEKPALSDASLSAERFREVMKQYLDSPSSIHLIKSRNRLG